MPEEIFRVELRGIKSTRQKFHETAIHFIALFVLPLITCTTLGWLANRPYLGFWIGVGTGAVLIFAFGLIISEESDHAPD